LSCLVGLALVTPSVGIRKTRRSNDTLELASDCGSLSDIVVDGKNFGKGFELICNFWPSGLGDFPIEDVSRARQLAEKAVGPGGTLDQIREIRENRQSRGFCWRNETLRNVVETDCEREIRGVCYGDCPSGYQPGLLSGIFGAACTTVCSATDHTRGCGFGCATGLWACARSILDQASSVANGVGSVYSFVTGNENIPRVVDAVVTFAEFLLSVVPSLVETVKDGIDIIRDAEHPVMAVVAMYQFVQEVGPEFGASVRSIMEAFEELGDIIADLVQERQTTGSISVGRIVRAILDHGENALDYAKILVEAFSHPRCQVR